MDSCGSTTRPCPKCNKLVVLKSTNWYLLLRVVKPPLLINTFFGLEMELHYAAEHGIMYTGPSAAPVVG